jgi:hypothetical protein
MRSSPRISVDLDVAGGRPPLSDFSSVCATLRTCLSQVSRAVTDAEVEFEICDLRLGSAILEVIPVANGTPEAVLQDIEDLFLGTVHSIQNGLPLDRRLDFQAVRAFVGFGNAVKKNGVSLSVGGTRLTAAYVTHLSDLLEAESPAAGSASGTLEAVSIHKGHRFFLYPPAEGEKIECRFNQSGLRDVLNAIGKKVTVFGTLHYAKTKTFPVLIDVESFVEEPDDATLPTLLRAIGLLGDVTSNEDAGAWRNEW